MDNPASVNEATSDDVLWRRHERPTDAFYLPFANMSFRSAATNAIREGPQSFPIIRDPSGAGGDLIGGAEQSDSVTMCRRAWTIGDPLYFDQNSNDVVDDGTDTLLSTTSPSAGFVDLGHGGAPLRVPPSYVRFVDADGDSNFDIGERIYRDENNNGRVGGSDTLLVGVAGTVVGNTDPTDSGSDLVQLPGTVRYLDLIRQPPNTFNIGYPAVQGVTGVNADDVEIPGLGFPVHGNAVAILGAVMDDSSQYLPPGPDFRLFETQLVGHEFGHNFTLSHGDGIDDDMDGQLDDGDDPTAPFPGAGPGTLCDSNNVMSYCWKDDGTSGNPDMRFIGVGTATSGVFTNAQRDQMRDYVLANVSDRFVDPVSAPLVSARVDTIGEVPARSGYVDISDFSVSVDASGASSVFSLTTRRPLPEKGSDRIVDFHFLLDVDGDPTTGGSGEAAQVPSDFTGAEFVASLSLRDLRVRDVSLLKYDGKTGEFALLDEKRIRGIRETVTTTPNFPMGDRGTVAGPVREIPVAETIKVIAPNELIDLPADALFRVEFVANDVDAGIDDVAGSSGMNFALPVFPECRTEPARAEQGDEISVTASGLLPDRDVHLLLGPTEVAEGRTDGSGQLELPMEIPSDASRGRHLITVGALAVTADCTVVVGGREDGEDKSGGDAACCSRLTWLLGINTFLLVAIVVMLLRIITRLSHP